VLTVNEDVHGLVTKKTMSEIVKQYQG